MSLIEIEYGSLASSEVMNKNFNYLDDKSSEISKIIENNVATLTANIATLNTSISNTINSTNSEIKNIKSVLTSSGLMYITTYINGTSWYREFFSDSNKTKRIWLEQGGRCTSTENDSRYLNVTYIKHFSNNNYTITLAGVSTIMNNSDFGHIYSLSNTGVRFNAAAASNPIIWFACGN